MRLQSYLTEFVINKVEKEISREEFANKLKKNCKKSLNTILQKNKFIYRGIDTQEDFLFFDGTKERRSANTANHYTILFSKLLDGWKGIPKRNKALICTTNWQQAGSYGHPYIVIPYDDTKIAYCSNKNDIWDTVENNKIICKLFSFSTLNGLNNIFEKFKVKDDEASLKKHLSLKLKDLQNDDENALTQYKFYVLLAKNMNPDSKSVNIENMTDDWLWSLPKGIKVKDVLEHHLSPEMLKIKVSNNIQSFPFDKLNNNECWMDKPALLIRKDIFPAIMDVEKDYSFFLKKI